ncbi:MAG: hypothetical protein JNK05_06005 [Myxococcales bacterium]|nr:hypothetical protein [Myxococcales bacterium]
MAKATKKRSAARPAAREAEASNANAETTEAPSVAEAEQPADAGEARAKDSEARDEADEGAAVADKQEVSRTPLRAAGSVREVNREVALGLLVGVAVFALGAYAVYWSSMRWMLRGGSSTLMAVSFLLPVTVPILIGSVLGERGRKAFGYSMIGGVMIGTVIAGMYVATRFSETATMRPPPALGPAMQAPR